MARELLQEMARYWQMRVEEIRTLAGFAGRMDDVEAAEIMLRIAVVRLVAEGAVAPERLVFLHDLFDLPQIGEWRTLYDAMDNTARNRGKRELAAALVARGCGSGPTLIIVEDLHWADPQVLGYLAAFATAVGNRPGLLVMTSRVEGDPLDAAWRASCRGTPFAIIDLGPLRGDEALSLAGGFIGTPTILSRLLASSALAAIRSLEQLLHNAEEGSQMPSLHPSRVWSSRAWIGWRNVTGRRFKLQR